MFRRLTLIAATAVAGTMAFSNPGFTETIDYSAGLAGANEVPPATTPGTGTVEATYDTESKMLNWTITFSGLTGDATAAHFHGPAAAGSNAPPVIPIEGNLSEPINPIEGSATLTDAQAADLEAGKWYLNVHTAQYPGGEIRGQLAKQ